MLDPQETWPTRGTALTLLLAIGVLVAWRAAHPVPDHRVPAAAAEAWMADALPDVGPKRRAAAAAAIRAGRLDELPKAARPVAETVFRFELPDDRHQRQAVSRP